MFSHFRSFPRILILQVVAHNAVGLEDQIYDPLLGHLTFDGASLQCGASQAFSDTLKWVQESKAASHKWIVTNDEQSGFSTGVLPDANDPTHDAIRKNFLWGNVMAGGAGGELRLNEAAQETLCY
jgi:hypothetical protein